MARSRMRRRHVRPQQRHSHAVNNNETSGNHRNNARAIRRILMLPAGSERSRQLVDIARSRGGLLDNGLRCRAWAVLLGVELGDNGADIDGTAEDGVRKGRLNANAAKFTRASDVGASGSDSGLGAGTDKRPMIMHDSVGGSLGAGAAVGGVGRSAVEAYLWDVARLAPRGPSPDVYSRDTINDMIAPCGRELPDAPAAAGWDSPFVLNRSVSGCGPPASSSLPMVSKKKAKLCEDSCSDSNLGQAEFTQYSLEPLPPALAHRDADQVRKDVSRSLWNVPARGALRGIRRQQLIRTVLALLYRHPALHYYQGLHDVVAVFLIVTEDVAATFLMAERLALWHLQFAVETSLQSTQQILRLIFPLIERADSELFEFLKQAELEPIFALAWVLTWFSHSFGTEDEAIARLFDVFLCSHPLFPLYVGASIVLRQRDHLLYRVDCDMPSVHSFLTKLPLEELPLEDVIQEALALFDNFPPDRHLRSRTAQLPYDWMHGNALQHHTALSLFVANTTRGRFANAVRIIMFGIVFTLFVVIFIFSLLQLAGGERIRQSFDRQHLFENSK